jgi:hypothetical protein
MLPEQKTEPGIYVKSGNEDHCLSQKFEFIGLLARNNNHTYTPKRGGKNI